MSRRPSSLPHRLPERTEAGSHPHRVPIAALPFWQPGAAQDNLCAMDAETVRTMLLRNLGRAADDPVGSHDMYDDDAVLEFPQSGERFEGVANIREWRSRYPGSVTYDIR